MTSIGKSTAASACPGQPMRQPILSWEFPYPGVTIRVLLRSEESGWADVIERQERQNRLGLFCQMIETRQPFWFSPELVSQGSDSSVASWEPPEEDENVVLFRRSEVERLHRALQADGRSIAVLGNDVRHVPGFRTQPSQVRAACLIWSEAHRMGLYSLSCLCNPTRFGKLHQSLMLFSTHR